MPMTTLPTDELTLSALLYGQLLQRSVDGRQVKGIVSSTLNFHSVVSACNGHPGMFVSCRDDTQEVEFNLPSNFFTSVEDMLAAPVRHTAALPRFYIADEDFVFPPSGAASALGPPKSVKYYLSAIKLYQCLSQISDYQTGSSPAKTLGFLSKERLEVTPEYEAKDLHDLKALPEFQSEFIDSETHQEQKRTIIKTVLIEFFTGEKTVPLSRLLAQFDDFYEKIKASYQLYVSEFSFQKVKEEIEKERLDATTKLNKVFSDIQNQLLAVPVALVLAGGQMSHAGVWTSKNILIWFGVLVFSVFMALLLRNQQHTLLAVKQEIDQQWQQISGKYHSVATRFNKSYQQLDDRYHHQERLIDVVDLFVALVLGAATTMLLSFSASWLRQYIPYIWGLSVTMPFVALAVKMLLRFFKKKGPVNNRIR